MVHVEGVKRSKGTQKMIWVKAVRSDMSAYNLMEYIALDRVECQNKICVAVPK